MKKLKKGFTIVELVIVIAIIAILAAVLIPTFSNVINKANVSNDYQVIRNCNTALATEDKPATMHDALKIVEEFGYNVSKINAKGKDAEILYDSKNNVFCYWDGANIKYIPETELQTKNVKEWEYWEIIDAKSDEPRATIGNKKWSLYLRSTKDKNLKVSTGIDVGNCADIESISYSNTSAQNVVIRTNSASAVLTVDAEYDTVAHYGEAGFLDIIRVNTASYHEFGYVPQAQIAQGRIVNEAGSVETEDGSTKKAGVENLFIVAATEGSGETAGTFSDIIVEAAQGAEVPALDRSDVNIVGSVLVVEVKTVTTDDFVYLTKSGIVEQVVVTTEKGNTDTAGAKATTGNDSSLNATASKAADEIANIAKRNAQGQVLASDGTTPIEDVSTINSVADITIAEPKATKADLEKSQGENALFAGGAGTENNPYLISNVDQWMNLVKNTTAINEKCYLFTKDKYFKLTSDLDFSNCNERADVYFFAGNFDFGNHSLSGFNGKTLIDTDDGNAYIFYMLGGSVSFKNLNLYTCNVICKNNSKNCAVQLAGNVGSNGDGQGAMPTSAVIRPSAEIVFDNVNIYGNVNNVTSNNIGLYIGNCFAAKATFINCNNYANVFSSGYVSAFVGGLRLGPNEKNISFINCNNFGKIISTNESASLFVSNPTVNSRKNNFIVENCSNYGIIVGVNNNMNLLVNINSDNIRNDTLNGTIISGNDASTVAEINRILSNCGNQVYKINTSKLESNNGFFVLNSVDNASKYELSFNFMAGGVSKGGNNGYSIIFDGNQGLPTDVKVGNWINKADAKSSIVEHRDGNGTLYFTSGDSYVFNDDNSFIRGDVVATFVAYSENGTVLSISTYIYSK